jgi:uncharacterized protein YigE (DUF2233 family)
MRRLALILSLFLLLVFPARAFPDWRTLEPGLEYESRPTFSAHIFRIDPKKFRVDLLLARDFGGTALTADSYRRRSGAVLAINGGFFDAGFRSLGLLHRRGQTLQPLREVSWGVFAVSAQGTRILSRTDWNPAGVETALQVGPRLVVDGAVQKFKEAEPSRRSGVCLTPEGKLEIAVAEKPILLSEWAAFLQKDCPNALNLDGGGSTQISAKVSDWSLTVEGLTTVPNALAVLPY